MVELDALPLGIFRQLHDLRIFLVVVCAFRRRNFLAVRELAGRQIFCPAPVDGLDDVRVQAQRHVLDGIHRLDDRFHLTIRDSLIDPTLLGQTGTTHEPAQI